MTNLINFEDAVQVAWEAMTVGAGATQLTDDGTGKTISFIDNFVEERGSGKHRQAIWRLPPTLTPQSTAAQVNEWQPRCEVFFERLGRTYHTYRRDAQTDVVRMQRVFLNMTNFGANVGQAVLQDVNFIENPPRRMPKAGGVPNWEVARALFVFSVRVGEA